MAINEKGDRSGYDLVSTLHLLKKEASSVRASKEALVGSKWNAEGLKQINEREASEHEKLWLECTFSDSKCNDLLRKLKVVVPRFRLGAVE